jgi:tripartite-type tricarboxylate transporter receptor subunit TctC
MAGRVDVYFAPITPAMALIREGKLLALAVSSAKRSAALPNVPTTIEAGYPNSDFDFWVGMFVPKRTPRDIVNWVHQETVKGLENPAVREKLAALGVEAMIMKPEDFDARVAKETRIAVELARAAHIPMQ